VRALEAVGQTKRLPCPVVHNSRGRQLNQ